MQTHISNPKLQNLRTKKSNPLTSNYIHNKQIIIIVDVNNAINNTDIINYLLLIKK